MTGRLTKGGRVSVVLGGREGLPSDVEGCHSLLGRVPEIFPSIPIYKIALF
jgi:hypothetical protein